MISHHHRHDGTSPLPLGMDASPAPSRWTGADTIWPHDPRFGWSYCVMIPSWIVLPEARTADGQAIHPTVFYRVQVGLQSPEGVSSLHGILRRFSDFLKIHVALKRMFPRKKLPVPPPKKSLMQIIPNKNHLQQRRYALIDWIVKLLADIDVSRSAPMSSFLELEEAARSIRPDIDKQELRTSQADNFYLDSEETSSLKDMMSIEEGDNLEATSVMSYGDEKASSWHRRRHSIDSNASELSSTSGSELYFTAVADGRDQDSEGFPILDAEILKAVQALLPVDQRGNVRRLLATLQRRLTTAKDDMEDLVARFNQETAVKDFLSTKVRDLEAEIQKLREKSKESLQQAVSMEREGYTNLQWELEESRVALIRAGEQARLAQDARSQIEERLQVVEAENKRINHELLDMREKNRILQVDRDNIKGKARAEMKVLAKEIKALRTSQPELKQKLELALKTNKELEIQMRQQKKQKENTIKILQDVGALRERLQQCTVDFLAKEDAQSNTNSDAVTDAADLLMTSDSRIGLLLAEAQLLADEEDEEEISCSDLRETEMANGVNDDGRLAGNDGPVRKMLTEIFIDNAHLHKLVNSLTLKALLTDSKPQKRELSEASVRKSVLNRFL